MVHWAFLILCLATFATGLGRLWRGRSRPTDPANRWSPADGAALLVLTVLALLTVRPYWGDPLVGGGDSYFYGLQVADAVTQLRAGVLPLFAGQSDYAFNGNINSLRTAPYFTHFAGLLDLLTLRQLSFVRLMNLTIVASALLAAWFAYLAAREATGRRRLASALLAAGYVASPALLAPLFSNDMVATYLTAPWLILCWHGLAGILHSEDDGRSQLLAAGSLGLLWLAHSPIAGWMSLAWALVLFLRLLLNGGQAGQWRRHISAGLLLACLVGYTFVSVAQLEFRPPPTVRYEGFAFAWPDLREALQEELKSHLGKPSQLPIRLGWSHLLLGAFAMGLFAWRRRWGGLIMVGLLAGFLPYLWPVPVLSKLFWQLVPDQLLMLSIWTNQRLCPLLAAGTVIAAAWALRPAPGGRRPAETIVVPLLALLLAGNFADTFLVLLRRPLAQLSPAAQAVRFSPQNLELTRYSYLMFERTPGYFTNGWTDPEFESRLFDANLELHDHAAAILAAAGPGGMTPIQPGATVPVSGPADYLLQFAFTDPAASGALIIEGAGISRTYALPSSGEAQAFGAAPSNAKTIPLRVTAPGSHLLSVSSTVPGVSVRVIPFPRDALPVRLKGQTPYTASVQAPGAGFLETPRVFLRGYAATVNGRDTPVQRSANNLVMVPVPAGKSTVVVTYPGPLSLHLAWLVSFAALAAWPWLLVRTPRAGGAEPAQTLGRGPHLGVGLATVWRRHPRVLLAGTAALLLTVAGLAGYRSYRLASQAYGSLRMELEFPKHTVRHHEPLLVLGRPGAADCLYVIYEDERHIRLALDHWGAGGPTSEPIALNFNQPHTLEVTIGSLYPASIWRRHPNPPGLDATGRSHLRVTLDGRVVFDQPQAFHQVKPGELVLGRNTVGSSVAGETFSGRVRSIVRFVIPPR